jgi:dihydroorotase
MRNATSGENMIITRNQEQVPTRIRMRIWDNWHNHFRRRGDQRFNPTVDYLSRFCLRANGMGNHDPDPTLTASEMLREKADVEEVAALLGRPYFRVLPTIMVSPQTTPRMVEEAIDAGAYGIKVMPANATTHSAHGLTDYFAPLFLDCCRVLIERRKTLLLHAELAFWDGAPVPKHLRSKMFLLTVHRLRERLPDLRICIEHIDIREFVQMVIYDENMCATVTPHHMDVTAAMADEDVHLQCAPYPKTQEDIDAIQHAVIGLRHPRFFYGSDNAPHLRPTKERTNPPPAFGVFTAPVEPGVMTQMFERAEMFERYDCLDALEPFTSEFGARWHGFPLNEGKIELVRNPTRVPMVIDLGGGHEIVPYKHGDRLDWRLVT